MLFYILFPAFFIALIFAYRIDLKNYLQRYGKNGQYVIYIIVFVLMGLMIIYKLIK